MNVRTSVRTTVLVSVHMSTRRVELRMKVELADWVDAYAKERGSTKTAVIEAAIGSFREDAARAVPDLERAASMTPRPSPAGRQAKSEVGRDRADAGPTAPQRASAAPLAGDLQQRGHRVYSARELLDRERQERLNRGR